MYFLAYVNGSFCHCHAVLAVDPCSGMLPNMGNNTMSVAEAAKYLGVHRNTVLNRIKTGALPAQPIVQPNGTKSYRIPIEALPNAAQNLPNTGQPNWAHNDAQPAQGAQESPIVSTAQQAQYEALAGPFLAQIVQLGQDKGRLEAQLDAARQRIAELEASVSAPAAVDPPVRRSWWDRIRGVS